MPDGGETKALGTASLRRRRLPRDTLIKLDFGLALTEQVPVRHRFGSILPAERAPVPVGEAEDGEPAPK